MIALQKPNGGVRGIVVGDVVRRLVAKTMAKQFMTKFEAATKPFQYALATRAESESIAHAVQVVSDMDPRATVLSIDGVGAFDLISRRAMMCAVQRMPDGETFHSSPNFTDTLPHICGKTRKGLSTRFHRAKVANKETL